jgi:hypothetical protein
MALHRRWRMRAARVGLVALLGSLALWACELGDPVDGGSGGGLGPEQTVTLSSTGTLDGWVRVDGTLQETGTQVIVGDADVTGFSRATRGFYSFPLATIPAGATVTSAELRVNQIFVTGTPYGSLGSVVADHVDYGATLDASDYNNATLLASSIGTVSVNTALGFKSLFVTARVQADVAAPRPRAQFRLRFSGAESNNNGSGDYAQFTDGEYALAASRPQLVVKYRVPVTP